MVAKNSRSFNQNVHYYELIGRTEPTKDNEDPKIYKMKIFAKNKVLAESQFWSNLKKIKKVKRSKGELLSCSEIYEKNPLRVKTFGVHLRYISRTGSHDMYKEYRDLTVNGAVSQLYAELAGRHRALPSAVTIFRIQEIAASDARRTKVTQMLKGKLKWPSIRRLPMVPKEKKRSFRASRPTTFFH